MSLSHFQTSHMQSLQHAQIFPCLRSVSPRSPHGDTAEKHDASPPALTGKKGELPDARAVELRNREFQERAKAQPGFARAAGLLNERTVPPPKAVEAAPPPRLSELLATDIPVGALRRALQTSDDERRRRTLVWAYHLDRKRDTDAADRLTTAFGEAKAKWDVSPHEELSSEKLRSIVDSIEEAHPEVIDALREARAEHRALKERNIFHEMLESQRGDAPIERAFSLAVAYGIARDDGIARDVDFDTRLFLALADAIEAQSPGSRCTGDGLRKAADVVLEHDPDLARRVREEIDRCKRMRDITSRKKAAALRSHPAERSRAVVLDSAIAPASAEELLPDEPFVKLASATRHTTQRKIQAGVLVMPDVEPSLVDQAADRSPPSSGRPSIAIVSAVGAMRADGEVKTKTEGASQPLADTPRGGFAAAEVPRVSTNGASAVVAPAELVAPAALVASEGVTPSEEVATPLTMHRASAWAAAAAPAPFEPPPIGGPRVGALEPASSAPPHDAAKPEDRPPAGASTQRKKSPWIVPGVALTVLMLGGVGYMLFSMSSKPTNIANARSTATASIVPLVPTTAAPVKTVSQPAVAATVDAVEPTSAPAPSSSAHRKPSGGPHSGSNASGDIYQEPTRPGPFASSISTAHSAAAPTASTSTPTFTPKWEQ